MRVEGRREHVCGDFALKILPCPGLSKSSSIPLMLLIRTQHATGYRDEDLHIACRVPGLCDMMRLCCGRVCIQIKMWSIPSMQPFASLPPNRGKDTAHQAKRSLSASNGCAMSMSPRSSQRPASSVPTIPRHTSRFEVFSGELEAGEGMARTVQHANDGHRLPVHVQRKRHVAHAQPCASTPV